MYTGDICRVAHVSREKPPRSQTSQLTAECIALGRRIKQLRAERSITQEELADRAGLFRTYMSRIERGSANPSLTMLHAIASAFEVPVAGLFELASKDIPSRVRSAAPTPSRGRT